MKAYRVDLNQGGVRNVSILQPPFQTTNYKNALTVFLNKKYSHCWHKFRGEETHSNKANKTILFFLIYFKIHIFPSSN